MKFRALLVLALVFCSSTVGHAADWLARHGLTSSEYQAKFDEYAQQGWRLKQVSGYVSGGKVRYAALWDKSSGPAWKARHGLTNAEYQKAFDEAGKLGYRLVFVDGYEVDGSDRYAAIWEKRTGPAMIARHGLTDRQYQDAFNELTGKGYRLLLVDGYAVGGSARYAAIFEKSSGPGWVARHGLSAAEYQKAFDDYGKQGFRLKLVSGYRAGSDRYAAIWEKANGPYYSARHGIPNKWYQNVFDNHRYQGYRPVWINAFTSSGDGAFNGIWTNTTFKASELDMIAQKANGYLSTYGYPGVSFALVKDGRLVFAAGFGLADKATGEQVGPNSRFRVASVSKPLTGIAVTKLAEKGKIDLGKKVFGKDGYLSSFTIPKGEEKLADIEVRQLLQHVAGFSKMKIGSERGDPMFNHTSLNHTDLIQKALDNDVFVRNPGTQYEYSNFGFCLAGRVIEKATGKTYEQAVKDEVFTPAGAKGITIAKNAKADRQANEVVYYPEGAYDLNVTRFDAHGGWIATPIDLLRVLVRADGLATKSDIISTTSHTTMTTAAGIDDKDGNDPTYALGWGVASGQSHNGSMSGTLAQLVHRSDGWALAAVVNQRSDGDKWAGNLQKMVEEIIAGVSAWPTGDLF